MKKSAKRIEIIGIISLFLLCFGFNFNFLVLAQDGNRVRVFQQKETYLVEIKAKNEQVKIEVSLDGSKSSYSIAKNGSLTLNAEKNLKLKYSKNLINKFQVLINGKEATLPSNSQGSNVEVEFNQSKLSQFPAKTPVSTPIPTPTATPVLTPTPTPTPTPIPAQTLPELQTRIRGSLSRAELRRGTVGIKIFSLATGKVVYEENAEKYVMPASNMKSFTVATALERLSPNFRITTSVYANALPDSNGVIKGDLTIYGRGDISMAFSFLSSSPSNPTNADYLRLLEPLADKIIQAGIKRIEGNLVGDESYFNSNALPPTWEWDDLQSYYGAEISALGVLDNAVDLSIKPTSLNSPCAVQILPINTMFTIVNNCVTNASGNRRNIKVVKKLDRNILEISGTMPLGDNGYRGSVAVSRPAQLFIEMLRQLLQQKGVTITGQNRVVNAKEKSFLQVASQIPPIEVTKLESPPMSLIAAKTMKPSQNMYTEILLRILGEQVGDKTNPNSTSEDRGIEVVKNFLNQAGVASGSVVQYDGSGLSRHNLVTAASSAQLYSYMSKSPNVQAWRDSLTIGAVDGTLRNRFSGTAAANNARGKTGTIDQVSALSGYVTTAAGEQLVFSIIVNGVIGSSSIRTSVIDSIVVSLANFNGKID